MSKYGRDSSDENKKKRPRRIKQHKTYEKRKENSSTHPFRSKIVLGRASFLSVNSNRDPRKTNKKYIFYEVLTSVLHAHVIAE